MTGDVIDLQERREERLAFWRCECGCITFYVRSDNELECPHCKALAISNGFWRVPEGETREETPDDGHENSREEFCDPSEGLAAMLRFINQESAACVILLQDNGKLHTWSKGFTTRAGRGWLRERLEEARKMVVDKNA